TVVDPAANTQLSGLYRSGSIYCTQCEAEGFRRITYFPDRPDVIADYTTRIEAANADAPGPLASGNRAADAQLPRTDPQFAVPHAARTGRARRRDARLSWGPGSHGDGAPRRSAHLCRTG